jgi:hypothetical protein
MKQNTTESFRVEKDILDNVKLITSKTGQTSKGYISVILRKQIDKDLKKYFKADIAQNQREKSIINILSKC